MPLLNNKRGSKVGKEIGSRPSNKEHSGIDINSVSTTLQAYALSKAWNMS